MDIDEHQWKYMKCNQDHQESKHRRKLEPMKTNQIQWKLMKIRAQQKELQKYHETQCKFNWKQWTSTRIKKILEIQWNQSTKRIHKI